MGGASWWVGLAVVQRLKCIDGHCLGPRKVAVIRSRQVAIDQGFLKHCGEWMRSGPKVGLGGFCSKKALLCYAAIPMRKLYHAQHKVEYAQSM